jgi:hypothetical protein
VKQEEQQVKLKALLPLSLSFCDSDCDGRLKMKGESNTILSPK